MQQFQTCDLCKKRVEVDEGSFECAEIDPETRKCVRYVFVCDECTDRETEATL